MKILHIDASLRTTGSKTRDLTAFFMECIKARKPTATVASLDLTTATPPHVTAEFVEAYQTPKNERSEKQEHLLHASDHYINLMKDADILLFGVPMYNFSIPSQLKSFIDHIVRIDETFTFDGENFKGLLGGKKTFFCTSRGGVYREGPLKSFDQQEPYLRAVFAFIGLTDVHFIHTDGQDFAPGHWRQEAILAAKNQICKIVDSL